MGVLNALRDPIGLSLGIGVSRAVFRLRRDGRVDWLVRLGRQLDGGFLMVTRRWRWAGRGVGHRGLHWDEWMSKVAAELAAHLPLGRFPM